MSDQQFRGTLASGGTFVATSQGIEIFDPGGNQLARFGREVISGVSRDGQVVTVERHNDTIVTLTAASITDAVGLEQYIRDTIVAPPEPVPEPPWAEEEDIGAGLAFDAFDEGTVDEEPAPPEQPERPRIISRPEPSAGEEPEQRPHDLPEPVPTTPPPPGTFPQVSETAGPPPGAPETPAPPPPYAEPGEQRGNRRLLLWGCLGCGGLIVLVLICVAVLLATDAIDVDALSDDDPTPTPFVLIATPDDDDPTPTDGSGSASESTPTSETGGEENAPTQALSGDVLSAGESGTLNGVQVTYLSSRTDDGGVFPPDEGNEYLILTFQIENTTAEAVAISTLLQFELHDQAGEELLIALFAESEGGLDTEISAGDTIEGEVAFEVPQGGGPFTVVYQDLITDSSIEWMVE